MCVYECVCEFVCVTGEDKEKIEQEGKSIGSLGDKRTTAR
jgi:hypothetical protein